MVESIIYYFVRHKAKDTGDGHQCGTVSYIDSIFSELGGQTNHRHPH
jgi:hypothetical protein